VSLQPNSGASGEYAGLMSIRGYHRSRGDEHRNICIIPVSAHGTNPASAVMAGMDIVTVSTDAKGNIDIEEMRAKATQYKDRCGTTHEKRTACQGHPVQGQVWLLSKGPIVLVCALACLPEASNGFLKASCRWSFSNPTF
jgi:hypothetical protein